MKDVSFVSFDSTVSSGGKRRCPISKKTTTTTNIIKT